MVTRSLATLIQRGSSEGRPSLVWHVIGLSVAVAGLGVIFSGIVDVLDGGPDASTLLVLGLVFFFIGAGTWWETAVPSRVRIVDVFVVVTGSWLALAVVGAMPYLLTGTLDRFDDALFESISGFTTTGATVLHPIEGNSAGILMWRAISQWFGGMGVIVLVVAVLPSVGAGGMDLLSAEAPGPTGERLTPRVRQTASRLWVVYLGFTVLLVAAYVVAGMSLYDGVAHAFTTVSTGGFSPYNGSLGHFGSAAIEWICIVAMFIAGGSFTLWYRLLRGSAGPLLASLEFRTYALVVAGASTFTLLAESGTTGIDHDALRGSVFSVLTIVSTTGYGTVDFGAWSDASQILLFFLLPVGAMAGSTSGGVKLVRVLAVGSFGLRETLRQLHPRLVRPIRIGPSVLADDVANRVLGFLVLALAIFGAGAVAIAMTGVDVVTAFAASATSLGNVGPGIGEIGPTNDFTALGRVARGVTMVQMLLGRLEIYPVLLALAAVPGLRGRRS